MFEAERVLDAAQQCVVVVRLGVLGTRLRERRDHHRTRAAAAGPVQPRLRRVRRRLHAAARRRVALRPAELGLVEGHDQHTVTLEGPRPEDLRRPLAEPPVRRNEAAGLAVDARFVVAVVAEVRRDPAEVRLPRHRGTRCLGALRPQRSAAAVLQVAALRRRGAYAAGRAPPRGFLRSRFRGRATRRFGTTPTSRPESRASVSLAGLRAALQGKRDPSSEH